MLPIKIPKVAHCFWYSPTGLPYLRYLSIISFAILNPDFRLIYYTIGSPLKTGRTFSTHEQSVVHTSSDYLSRLLVLPNVDLKIIDNDYFAELRFTIDTAVHWSDVLRVHLLAHEGGYWIDSDIIFTKSLSNSFLGFPEYSDIDTIISQSSLGSVCPYLTHRIGFLAASPRSAMFTVLWDKMKKIDKMTSGYQDLGCILYNDSFASFNEIICALPDSKVMRIPNSALYMLHLTELFSTRIGIDQFVNNTFILGCHWYGGGDQLSDLIKQLNNDDDVENSVFVYTNSTNTYFSKLLSFAQKLSNGVPDKIEYERVNGE